MPVYVALLRAVNVGGTGKLPMADLRALCEAQGFSEVTTVLASGNAVLRSALDEAGVKRTLEAALLAYAAKPVGVMVRTGAEMAAVLAANPYASAAPNHTVAIFLDRPPPADFLQGVSGRADEEIAPGVREIYVSYGQGMGASKLRIACAAQGTARNMNTIAKLAELAC